MFVHRAAWGRLQISRDNLSFQLNAPLPRVSQNPKLMDRRFDAPKAQLRQVNVVLSPVDGSFKQTKGGTKLKAKANFYHGQDTTRNRKAVDFIPEKTSLQRTFCRLAALRCHDFDSSRRPPKTPRQCLSFASNCPPMAARDIKGGATGWPRRRDSGDSTVRQSRCGRNVRAAMAAREIDP